MAAVIATAPAKAKPIVRAVGCGSHRKVSYHRRGFCVATDGTADRSRSKEAAIATSNGKPSIKAVGLCGSLRNGSFHRGLLRAATDISKDWMPIEYVDVSDLPMINTDLEVDGTYPSAVEEFRQKIFKADTAFFASPEYNYSITPIMKNAIDWGSRPPNVWAGKAAAVVSAGGGLGGGRAQYHLRQIGVYLDLHFINKPELMIRAFEPPTKFDQEGNLIDPHTKEKLKEVLLALHAFSLRLRGCE